MKAFFSCAGVEIYHGRAEEVAPALVAAGRRFTALLGDPPYGIQAKTKNLSAKRGRIRRRNGGAYFGAVDWPDCPGDDKPFDPRPWISLAPKVVLWGANNFAQHLPPSSCWLAWDKLAGGTPCNSSDIELAWTNLPGPARLYSQLWRGSMRAGRENSAKQRRLHPFQKPVGLMHWVIRQARLGPKDLILDPWCGSGPVVEAAREAGVPVVAIDCEEWCCELAVNRCLQEVLAAPAPPDVAQESLW